MTIRKRLSLWYSGLLALIVFIFAITVMSVSRVTILQTIDSVLSATAEDVSNSITVVPVSDLGELRRDIVFGAEDMFIAPGFSLQVWRTHENGVPLAQPTLVRASMELENTNPLITPSGERTLFNSTTINGANSRVIAQTIYTPDGLPIGSVQIATPIVTVTQASDTLMVVLIIVGVISVLVSLGVGTWIAARVLEPINAITNAAANIAETEDLSTRIDYNGPPDELGRLTEVFNRTMERLETLFKVQQRFIGDVSHELRTPLTSVLGNLELMERYGVDQSSLDAIQREAERMTRMVNDLLLLTRADFGDLTVDFYEIDLDSVVLEVYEQALMLAKNRELKIVLDRVEPVQIESNVDRAKQLLLNIVSNAIKFTSDGGIVSIGVYPEDDHAILEVKDTGIGISEVDMKRIFDRFFQADLSRVHQTEADGAGLGLSIARWIVDIHGGSIEVESQLGEGTSFRVKLPKHVPLHDSSEDSSVLLHKIGSYSIRMRSHNKTVQQRTPLQARRTRAQDNRNGHPLPNGHYHDYSSSSER